MLKHMINAGYPAAGPGRVGQPEYLGRINTTASSYHSGRLTSQPNSPLGSIHHTPKAANGGLHIPRAPDTPDQHSPHCTAAPSATPSASCERDGVKEMLTSLGLLCLISLLLALLSLIFLLKISPVTASDVQDLLRPDQSTVISPEEYVIVYEVTLALCALSLSLNLCCLLVCAVQFLFAVKLVRDSPDGERTNKYLKKSSVTRVCAVGGCFISIPVFLTGLILYTFIQFHSTPAIVTSALIGFGIIFCGCAMVHNVFIWQKEKTNAVRALAKQQRMQLQQSNHSMHSVVTMPSPHSEHMSMTKTSHHHHHNHHNHSHSIAREASGSISPGAVPHATVDLSSVATTPHELSTLV